MRLKQITAKSLFGAHFLVDIPLRLSAARASTASLADETDPSGRAAPSGRASQAQAAGSHRL